MALLDGTLRHSRKLGETKVVGSGVDDRHHHAADAEEEG
jgi:hypothetical protein